MRFIMSTTDKHEFSSIWKWIRCCNDVMSHVGCVIKRDVYPQKCINVLKISVGYRFLFSKYPRYIKNIYIMRDTLTGRLAQLVERRTREHNVSGLYRCGFESPAGQLKLLIVFRMRR